MISWLLEGDGGHIHHEAYDKARRQGHSLRRAGPKGGGWFRGDFNTVADFKGARVRFGRIASKVIERLGATLVPLSQASSSIICSRARWMARDGERRRSMLRSGSTSSACLTTCRAGSSRPRARLPDAQDRWER